MRLYGLIEDLPLVAQFVGTVAAAFLAYECGFRAGRWRSQRSNHEQEVVVRLMVAVMLGLVTFILALTFWIAATHFDASRQSLLNQVNAIRAAYLRADLLPEPHRTEIRKLLTEYVDVRLEAYQSGDFETLYPRSEKLHSQLWSQAVAAKEKASSPIFAGHIIQSLNDVIAMQTRKQAIREEFHIPNKIWIVLYMIMTLSAAAIGCHAGLTGARRPLVVTAFVLVLSAVLLLIADLDNPRRGGLRVSQQSLVDLRKTMNDEIN